VSLAVAGNVVVPAILLLKERGYQLVVTRKLDAETWTAKRGEIDRSTLARFGIG
jgi:hypothetical protein